MSLNTQSLARLGSVPYNAGLAKSLYLYATDDNFAAVSGAGYFNNATKQLCKGDLILASLVNSGTPATTLLVVTSATGAAAVTTAAAAFA